MTASTDPVQEMRLLRERLASLRHASLRINESLDLDTVLQEALDSARALSNADYGVITLYGASGTVDAFFASGIEPDEAERLWAMPEGPPFMEHIRGLASPLRVDDFSEFALSLGLPDSPPITKARAFLAAPLRHHGETVGTICLATTARTAPFTVEDEETLVTFASQAAPVIINARRYRVEQRARQDLEALLDTAPVGVAVFDAETGELASANREVQRLISRLQTPGQPMEELLASLTVRRSDGSGHTLREFTLSRAPTIRAEEIVLEVPSGASMTVLVNATPIQADTGELVSFVVSFQDLTPLEELDRLRIEFLGMVSHELQVPLTSIKGSTGALLNESAQLDPVEMRQFHRIIDEQADHMFGLMGDLLDVARIETGTLSVDPEPTEVTRLVDDAKGRFLATGGHTDLRFELAPDLPLVMADSRRVVQVLCNLLSNAARHSPDFSPIRLTAERDSVYVAISVIDEGAGLDSDLVPELFEKFSRAPGRDRGRAPTGSGLGLAICKGIVEAHGGRIRAESEGPGMGSRFTFTLPAAGDAPVAAPSRWPGTRKQDGRLRVLAVDDDPQALRYVREVLGRAGYVPIVTGDAESALRLIQEEEPHLVLLDLMLPGIDGIELMSHILAITDVPVIFVSVYGQDDYIVRAFDAGAVDYVVKPFSTSELAARIRAALRKRMPVDAPERAEPYVLGDLTIDFMERRVSLTGRPVQLTATEYRVLAELAANAGRVLTHGQLLQRIWGSDRADGTAPVRNIIARLRRKLGDDARAPTYIFNESRVGYRVAKPEQ